MTEFRGKVEIQDSRSPEPFTSVTLDGDKGIIITGGNGVNGKIIFCDVDGKERIKIGVDESLISAQDSAGNNVFEVFNGASGIWLVINKDNVLIDGTRGDMTLTDEEGHRGFALMSKAPSLSGLKPTTGMWIGASPSEGPKAGIVFIRDTDGNDSIKLDGASGDIILSNADCAEEFDVAQPSAIEPGSVVVIDTDGKLRESDRAYDKRVAGVISGAKGYRPGIILDKSNSSTTRRSVSLMGKVYCKADPAYAPIEVGDLLTTSNTPGHAMKATNPTKAFGSVIGKALSSIERKAGLIPILVTLQ